MFVCFSVDDPSRDEKDDNDDDNDENEDDKGNRDDDDDDERGEFSKEVEENYLSSFRDSGPYFISWVLLRLWKGCLVTKYRQ